MRGERDVRVEGASEMVEQSESVDTLDERREWNATGMMICRLDSSDMGASRSMSKAKDGSEDGKGTSFICLAHCCKTKTRDSASKKSGVQLPYIEKVAYRVNQRVVCELALHAHDEMMVHRGRGQWASVAGRDQTRGAG